MIGVNGKERRGMREREEQGCMSKGEKRTGEDERQQEEDQRRIVEEWSKEKKEQEKMSRS